MNKSKTNKAWRHGIHLDVNTPWNKINKWHKNWNKVKISKHCGYGWAVFQILSINFEFNVLPQFYFFINWGIAILNRNIEIEIEILPNARTRHFDNNSKEKRTIQPHVLFLLTCLQMFIHAYFVLKLVLKGLLRALRFKKKYLHLCSEDKRRSYGFGATWWGVINDRIFIFGWTNPLKQRK